MNIEQATPLQIAEQASHKARLLRIAARAITNRATAVEKPRDIIRLDRDFLHVATPPPEPPAPRPDPVPMRPNSIDAIIYHAARHFGVTRTDIKSARRTADVLRPRQIAIYLCRTLTLRSLPEIGRRFGGRDHTTVIHAFRKIRGLIQTDAVLAHDVAMIEAELGGMDA